MSRAVVLKERAVRELATVLEALWRIEFPRYRHKLAGDSSLPVEIRCALTGIAASLELKERFDAIISAARESDSLPLIPASYGESVAESMALSSEDHLIGPLARCRSFLLASSPLGELGVGGVDVPGCVAEEFRAVLATAVVDFRESGRQQLLSGDLDSSCTKRQLQVLDYYRSATDEAQSAMTDRVCVTLEDSFLGALLRATYHFR